MIRETQGEEAYLATLSRLEADGNAMHHLIPDAVVRQHNLTLEAMNRVPGYTLDRGTNILDMPIVKNLKDDIIHNGSHPKYDNYVIRQLDVAEKIVTNNGKMSLDKANPKAINDVLLETENSLRLAIRNRKLPIDVIRELEEGGAKLK